MERVKNPPKLFNLHLENDVWSECRALDSSHTIHRRWNSRMFSTQWVSKTRSGVESSKQHSRSWPYPGWVSLLAPLLLSPRPWDYVGKLKHSVMLPFALWWGANHQCVWGITDLWISACVHSLAQQALSIPNSIKKNLPLFFSCNFSFRKGVLCFLVEGTQCLVSFIPLSLILSSRSFLYWTNSWASQRDTTPLAAPSSPANSWRVLVSRALGT